MTNQRKWLIGAVSAVAMLGAGQAAAKCGTVTIASMNWQSAEVLAEIDKFILSEGYGCKAELVPGDTMPTLTSMMEKGQPDVAPESLINAVKEPLGKAVAEGRLVMSTMALKDGGVEGIWMPKYIADKHPEIKTIADAFKRPDLFPAPEDKSKGALHNCPSGWACQINTGNAFKAWGGEKNGFTLVDTGSSAGLDGSIAKAYERKQGWLGYYWAPTSILGKYEMVKLDEGVKHDPEAWASCNVKEDCVNPQRTSWPTAEVYTVVTTRFQKQGGDAYSYLTKRNWGNQTVNTLLAWMSDNQAPGEDGAIHCLKTNESVWTKWVSADVAKKVKAAL